MESGEPKDKSINSLVRAAIELGGEVTMIDDRVPTEEEQAEIDVIKKLRDSTQGRESIKQ